MSGPRRISSTSGPWALHDVRASRAIEAAATIGLAPHALMQRAGLAVARLALSLAPQARQFWIAAGPGNNGGDGFEAAFHLHQAGCRVRVTAVPPTGPRPPDAAASLARALAAGVFVEDALPTDAPDGVAIDALLGLGTARAPAGAIAAAIQRFNQYGGLRLAVDLPSGLDADHGQSMGLVAQASQTLALLTLKPGLFTGHGRDAAGEVWFDELGCGAAAAAVPPRAWLGGSEAAVEALSPRRHAQHKGSFGDVLVVGGAAGMVGAALLAARAAQAGGAGRVHVSMLDPAAPTVDTQWPELMFRPAFWREHAADLASSTVVCGCGGGDAVRAALPTLLLRAGRLVIDADALNAIAADSALQAQLSARAGRGQASVLTPHPLEAARLLGDASTAQVQADRLRHADALAQRFGCAVLLKGSGSVIAAPGRLSAINASGNARLATAGTGDVLAGWLGGLWAAAQARDPAPQAWTVARAAAWLHGRAAESDEAPYRPLTASRLLQALCDRAATP